MPGTVGTPNPTVPGFKRMARSPTLTRIAELEARLSEASDVLAAVDAWALTRLPGGRSGRRTSARGPDDPALDPTPGTCRGGLRDYKSGYLAGMYNVRAIINRSVLISPGEDTSGGKAEARLV